MAFKSEITGECQVTLVIEQSIEYSVTVTSSGAICLRRLGTRRFVEKHSVLLGYSTDKWVIIGKTIQKSCTKIGSAVKEKSCSIRKQEINNIGLCQER